MKKILMWALVAVMVGAASMENASAQKFELGARVGVGSQNMDLPDTYGEAKARLGWNLAAVSRIRLIGFGDGLLGAGLFFQPEVIYSQNSLKIKNMLTLSPDRVETHDGKMSVRTVDVPLMLSLKVSIVRVQAGPVFNLMNNFKSVSGGLELLPLRPAVGYALGASVDLGGLVVDARYHGEFEKMSFKGSWSDIKSRFSSWSAGVGLMF